MPIIQSDKQQRDTFAQQYNDKFIASLVAGWREGKRLLVRNVIAECYSPHLSIKWEELVAAALSAAERSEFKNFMEAANG